MVGLRAPWGVEGGVESAVAEIAPRLAAAGCEVTVYCRGRYNPHGSCVFRGVRLIDTATVYSRSMEAIVHTAIATPRAIASSDITHFHACGPALFSPVPGLFGRVSVATIHGFDWEREKWGPAARAMLHAGVWSAGHGASALIGVSEEVSSWLARRFDAPVTMIPNGVAAHAPEPWDPLLFPSLRPGGYLLFIGRLVPEKDLLTLMLAAHRARGRLPIVVVGGGSYTDEYVTLIQRAAPKGVVFTGPRFGREKAMLLTHARAFVFPSRVEGLPIALLEALAAGLPVVASDIPANIEVLGAGPAWRVPVGNVSAWARALGEVEAASPDALAEAGARGRRRAEEHFGWDAVVNSTIAVYERALRERR